MMKGEYKIVVGCPNLRVYRGDIVVSTTNKPLLTNGHDESTTLNINGKIKRVKKRDIIYCANNGISLPLYLSKRTNAKYKGGNINQIRMYDDWCDWATRCAVSVRQQDVSPVLEYLYKRANNYISHLSYLDIDCDELYDIVISCSMEIANDIVIGKRTVFSPDNYIIKSAKNKVLKKLSA